MKTLSDADAQEFDRLGEEYDALQEQIAILLSNRSTGMSAEEIAAVYELTKEQSQIHQQRMALLDYQPA
ncbi:hypothetical protein [Rhizobium sp. SYY.PMSO]|uniref:hypothetical protein n=1 Tax=Rhizobium sp. SYY.PMSO TaxID=3382192 RepID=UPI00398FB353